MSKSSWFFQLSAIYVKGYEAAKDENATIEDCPYKWSRGVQQQRIWYWQRGFNRCRAGLPMDDSNG